MIDSDARYLYYVLDGGKAIRYGVTVGEEAMAWSGVAKVERMTEWPSWTPTPGERERMDVPAYVAPGPQNPMGARAMYLFEGNKDTLYRIHGTNQPEYIGQAISSGCIRMTNEDVIDLYKRVKQRHGRGGAGAASRATRRSIRAWLRPAACSAESRLRAEDKTAPSGAVFVFALRAQRHAHDLRRHAEAQRHLAAAEPAGHDHVAALLHDVAIGEARAVFRRRP